MYMYWHGNKSTILWSENQVEAVFSYEKMSNLLSEKVLEYSTKFVDSGYTRE